MTALVQFLAGRRHPYSWLSRSLESLDPRVMQMAGADLRQFSVIVAAPSLIGHGAPYH